MTLYNTKEIDDNNNNNKTKNSNEQKEFLRESRKK